MVERGLGEIQGLVCSSTPLPPLPLKVRSMSDRFPDGGLLKEVFLYSGKNNLIHKCVLLAKMTEYSR